MHFDLPDCRRCCFCVPLRHGILIYGYLNLLFSLFVLTVQIWLEVGHYSSDHTMFLYRGVGMYTHIWFPYLLYVMEVIFNILLLIGAHKKSTRLIRVYYYYGIATTLAVFLTFIVVRRYTQYNPEFNPEYNHDPFEIALAFSGLVLQCYLLLLIRTELNKLKYQGGQFRYVNHLAEVVVDPPPPAEGGQGGNPL